MSSRKIRASQREQIRLTQTKSVAFSLKMDFEPFDSWGTLRLLRDFDLFKKGRNREIKNIMRWTDDFMEEDIRVFDYAYEKGWGNEKRRFYQTVFFIKSTHLGMPEMHMQPENILHKIGAWMGMQDIDFEEFPKFSKNYLLQGDDEQYIREVMNQKVLKFFSRERNWHLESVNFFLVFYKRNKLLNQREIRQLYRKGKQINELLKQNWVITE